LPDLLTRTAIAAVAAVVVNVLVRAIALALFDIPDTFEHIELRAVIVSTLVGVVAAALVYAVIRRVARDPARTFTIVAVVALLLSLAAPLSLGFDETAAVCTLVLMHVLTAAIVIVSFTR
jgi:peptidoglycan/LPS O-acetylase OafA/YrhL